MNLMGRKRKSAGNGCYVAAVQQQDHNPSPHCILETILSEKNICVYPSIATAATEGNRAGAAKQHRQLC